MKKTILLICFLTYTLFSFAQCTELFFSEYVEGSNFNKALEIYNPTAAAIDLNTYRVVRWRNGGNTLSNTTIIQLAGTVPARGTYVAVKEAGTQQDGTPELVFPALEALADGFYCKEYGISSTFYFNGDDGISLDKFENGAWKIVDFIGSACCGDPGSGWNDVAPTHVTEFSNDSWTTNQTMIRKSSVDQGLSTPKYDASGSIVLDSPNPFNPAMQWDTLPENTFSELGDHVCVCNATNNEEITKSVALELYPNPLRKEDANLMITASEAIENVEIYNIVGQQLDFTTLDQQSKVITYQLDPNLNPGVYLVKIGFVNNKASVRKLIIK